MAAVFQLQQPPTRPLYSAIGLAKQFVDKRLLKAGQKMSGQGRFCSKKNGDKNRSLIFFRRGRGCRGLGAGWHGWAADLAAAAGWRRRVGVAIATAAALGCRQEGRLGPAPNHQHLTALKSWLERKESLGSQKATDMGWLAKESMVSLPTPSAVTLTSSRKAASKKRDIYDGRVAQNWNCRGGICILAVVFQLQPPPTRPL